MAILQQHADGIIRNAAPVREHQEYPKYMTHPAFEPGKVGQEVRSPAGFTYHVGGTPIRYPPMLVLNADQEAYYHSQGYVSHGRSDPEAFAAAVQAMPPPDEDYQPQEYPKWVGGVLVNNREEEERAAHKRRVQLGIDDPEVEPPEAPDEAPAEAPAEAPSVESTPDLAPVEPSPEPSPEPPPLAARMTALEASVLEIKQMFVAFMGQREPHRAPDVVTPEVPSIPVEPPPERATSAQSAVKKSPKPAKPRAERKSRVLSPRRAEAQRQVDAARRQVDSIMHPAPSR